MEITSQRVGEFLELHVTGRLDAYWAEHLTKALEEALREGADSIRLDMSSVSYMSSVGIRVLLRFYRQLQRIKGSFVVCNPSDAVKSVLELAGLQVLLAEGPGVEPSPVAAVRPAVGQKLDRPTAEFQVFELARGATMRCRLIGTPEPLLGCAFAATHCRNVSFAQSALGIGLGAFGNSYDECRGRLGAFV